jgi:hypothetical protein
MFKVGDRVRVIANLDDAADSTMTIGRECEITQIHTPRLVRVSPRVETDPQGSWFWIEELEAIEARDSKPLPLPG